MCRVVRGFRKKQAIVTYFLNVQRIAGRGVRDGGGALYMETNAN